MDSYYTALKHTQNKWSFHILMYSLADRLFIQGLKALSKQNVGRKLVERLDANSFPQAIIEIYGCVKHVYTLMYART
jgi:hypothetical protein